VESGKGRVFTVDTDQGPGSSGNGVAHALVTVACVQPPESLAGRGAEVIIIDCSASAGEQPGALDGMRRAVAAAVAEIPDGAEFAIVAGDERARQVYPPGGALTVAGPGTRAAAAAAASSLEAWGGTAMGRWLRAARDLLVASSAPLRHATLVAASRDCGEDPEELDAALAACEGVFTCDCRGAGTDWEVGELRKVSSALLGTIDIVRDPAGLPAELAAIMRASMSKLVAGTWLRVRTPAAQVRFVRQVEPTVEDLTARGVSSGPPVRGYQAWDYPAGAWGPGERRDYHLCIGHHGFACDGPLRCAQVEMVITSPGGLQVHSNAARIWLPACGECLFCRDVAEL
jgi:hypothetical protein